LSDEKKDNTNDNNNEPNQEESNNNEPKVKMTTDLNNNAIIEEDEEENTLDLERKDVHTLKKLRRLAENAVVNYEEEKVKRKAERKARYEAKMNDPKTKAMMRNMFEMEAELGSDNEENDDVVKKINRNEDGEVDSDEGEMDDDLKDMIDNLTTEKDGDNELLYNKFYEDILRQDKENLKKVLERAFNIKKRRSSCIEIGDGDRMDKVCFFWILKKFLIRCCLILEDDDD